MFKVTKISLGKGKGFIIPINQKDHDTIPALPGAYDVTHSPT